MSTININIYRYQHTIYLLCTALHFYIFIQLAVPDRTYNIGKTPTPHKSSEKTCRKAICKSNFSDFSLYNIFLALRFSVEIPTLLLPSGE